MEDKQHIKDAIETIETHAEYSEAYCKDVLEYSGSDLFIKHRAAELKAKAADTLKLIGALKQLLNIPQT